MVLNKSTYRIGLLILLQAAIFNATSWAQGQTGPHKKVNKAVHKLWGENLQIVPDSQASDVSQDKENIHSKDQIYHVRENGTLKGYVISSSAKGRFDEFDYSVIYDDKGLVLQVLVTIYRSTHGAAICQKNWLNQFAGYGGGKLELGKDIDAVSGGTLSATALVKDMQRLHLLLSSLIRKKTP